MRVAESIVLPDELERARAKGELVVFAGAGVSMGPPADLPSFEGLARDIVGVKVPWKEAYRKGLDRYLGIAERNGLRVQDRARAILSTDRPHNLLHEYLLGVFGNPETVQLITTNFDGHFTSAAETVFSGVDLPHYVGPALPPGRNFRGIAQLHGALSQPHQRLVLTDEDFATAYMTEGWATRFLVQVFTKRTVVFVGYSVTDPLIQYLLRAIAPTERWYALWHEEAEGLAPDHQIEKVSFRTSTSGDRYEDLNEGMKRWAWYATASSVDHDRELQRLISLGPPASPVDADYVRERLRTEEGRLTFWNHAKSDDWFDWASEEGFLNGLTEPDDADPATTGWGQWCLSNFSTGENPLLLRFLRGRPVVLHPAFRRDLQFHLIHSDSLPPRGPLRQFLALLLNDPAGAGGRGYDWQWLLEQLLAAELYAEVLAVLRAGTSLRLQPLERFYRLFEDEKSSSLRPLAVQVRTAVDPEALMAFLRKHGEELAEEASEALFRLGIQRIAEAYETLALSRGIEADADWLSYGRTAIAPSDQDSVARAIDVMITLVRISLDWFKDGDPESLLLFARQFDADERRLYQRLALYAYSIADHLSADEILVRATELAWPRDAWVRPEFYRLLTAHYSRASEAAKTAFLSKVRDDSWWGEELDEHGAHSRFSLSKKLLREAPDSPSTKRFEAEESGAHPKWGENDRDGYLSRVTAGAGAFPPSTIDSDEILESGPREAVHEIREELNALGDTEAAHSLLGALQQAARSEASWAVEALLESLSSEEFTPIAEALLWALRENPPSSSGQKKVLALVSDGSFPPGPTRALGMVISKWAQAIGRGENEEILDLFDLAADAIYENSADVAPGVEGNGWTEAAQTHPAGDAASVWWRVAEARDWVDGQFVISVDSREKSRWNRIAEEETEAAAFARPILGMTTNRLAGGDAAWASEAVFPLFDPSEGAERAAQLWDGRLSQHRWDWAVVGALKPHFIPFFRRSASMVPRRSRDLGDWVGMLVANPERSKITLNEIHEFIHHGTMEARVAFARSIPRHFESLRPDQRGAVWGDLLSNYWKDRQTNMPLPLDPKELSAMLPWLTVMPEVASEILEHLEGSPGDHLENVDDVLWGWKNDDSWVRANPLEAIGLVKFLAQRQSINSWMADAAVQVLELALKSGADANLVREAVELLVPGSRAASSFLDRLDEV